MNASEFESHIGGAVNAAVRDGINPSIIVTVLEGIKLEVLLRVRQQAIDLRKKAQEVETEPAKIVGLDGEPLPS